MSVLEVKWGDKKYSIGLAYDVTTIGRGDENLIQLKDKKVSRRHCKILKTPKGYQIVDNKSGNGTFVNGLRLDGEYYLKDSDVIRLTTTTGAVEIMFSDEEFKAVAEAVAAAQSGEPRPDGRAASPPPVLTDVSISDPQSRQDETADNPQGHPVGDSPADDEMVGATTAVIDVEMIKEINKEIGEVSPEQIVTPANTPKDFGAPTPTAKSPEPPVPVPLPVKAPAPKPFVPQHKPEPVKTPSTSSAVKAAPKPVAPPAKPTSTTSAKVVAASKPLIPATKPSGFSKLAKIAPGKRTGKFKTAAKAETEPTEPEKPDKKSKPAMSSKTKNLMLVGGIAAVVLMSVALLMSSEASAKRQIEINKKETEFLKQAKGLAESKKYYDAVKKLNEFLADKDFTDAKSRDGVQKQVELLEDQIKKEKAADIKLAPLVQKANSAEIKEYPGILAELKSFVEEYNGTEAMVRAQAEYQRLQRIAASHKESDAAESFGKTRSEADKLVKKKKYDDALAKWGEFSTLYPNLDDILRNKVNNEVQRIKNIMEQKK